MARMLLATCFNARSMAGMRIGTVVFSGKSGEKYRFEAWSLDTRFKAMPAVYFVTKREVTTSNFTRAGHEHMFLGYTADLSGPLGTAAQLAWFEKHGANCVCVYPAEEPRGAAIQQDLEEAYPTTYAQRNERKMFALRDQALAPAGTRDEG
jgi:hypothetical protein